MLSENEATLPHTEPSRPFLSVVIPTFNRAGSLMRTLEGLRCQSLPPASFEVVAVSDGSTDGTDSLLTAAAERQPYRLRPVRQKNGGPSRARNRGVQEACGEVIVFLDDDVEPSPGLLATHAIHHRMDTQVVVIGPMLPDPACRRAEPPWVAWEHAMLGRQYAAWGAGEWKGAGPNHFYSGNASVRRDHLLAVGGFDEEFTRQEDVELAFRLARERRLRFVFDADARGVHRPSRTFAAWLKTPYAYGRLDVTRAERTAALGGPSPGAGAGWDAVQFAYEGRRFPTRLAARAALAAPALSAPLRAVLHGVAAASYRCGAERVSFAALSMIYNVRYLEGARDAMGGARQLFAAIRPGRPSLPTIRSEVRHERGAF